MVLLKWKFNQGSDSRTAETLPGRWFRNHATVDLSFSWLEVCSSGYRARCRQCGGIRPGESQTLPFPFIAMAVHQLVHSAQEECKLGTASFISPSFQFPCSVENVLSLGGSLDVNGEIAFCQHIQFKHLISREKRTEAKLATKLL